MTNGTTLLLTTDLGDILTTFALHSEKNSHRHEDHVKNSFGTLEYVYIGIGVCVFVFILLLIGCLLCKRKSCCNSNNQKSDSSNSAKNDVMKTPTNRARSSSGFRASVYGFISGTKYKNYGLQQNAASVRFLDDKPRQGVKTFFAPEETDNNDDNVHENVSYTNNEPTVNKEKMIGVHTSQIHYVNVQPKIKYSNIKYKLEEEPHYQVPRIHKFVNFPPTPKTAGLAAPIEQDLVRDDDEFTEEAADFEEAGNSSEDIVQYGAESGGMVIITGL